MVHRLSQEIVQEMPQEFVAGAGAGQQLPAARGPADARDGGAGAGSPEALATARPSFPPFFFLAGASWVCAEGDVSTPTTPHRHGDLQERW